MPMIRKDARQLSRHRPHGRALIAMRTRTAFAACAALLFTASAAFAHATLIASEPSDGAVLAEAPARAMLTFNEPVSPLVMRLIDDRGVAIDLEHRVEADTVVAMLPPELAHGSHTVSWRVISTDGHPVGGSLVFSVGAPSVGVGSGGASATDASVAVATWACRVAIYVAVFGGIGWLFFTVFVARLSPASMPALIIPRRLLALGILAEPVSIGLQGLDALGLPLASLVNGSVWQTALSTTYSTTAIIALVALALAFAGTFLPRGRWLEALSGISLVGVGIALAASGHASAAPPQWLTRPAVFIHATTVAIWVGALIPLATLLDRDGGTTALARFSRMIPFALVPLVAAGVTLAVVQVETPAAVWSTAYGRVLIAKLLFVAALLGLAALNRWRLTAPTEVGERAATRSLIAAIAVESALAVAVLGTVALWRFNPPPRSLEAATQHPVSVHIHTEKAMADVSFSPGRAGPVRASIFVMTGDFAPLAAKEVTVSISSPTLGIEPISRPAKNLGDGSWEVADFVIPAPGRWNVEVAILISDFDLVRLQDDVAVDR